RGARLRAMNFWLFAFAIGPRSSQLVRATAPGRPPSALFLVLLDAGDDADGLHALRRQILEDIDEVHGGEPLRALENERHRARRLVVGVVAADLLEQQDDVAAVANDAVADGDAASGGRLDGFSRHV